MTTRPQAEKQTTTESRPATIVTPRIVALPNVRTVAAASFHSPRAASTLNKVRRPTRSDQHEIPMQLTRSRKTVAAPPLAKSPCCDRTASRSDNSLRFLPAALTARARVHESTPDHPLLADFSARSLPALTSRCAQFPPYA